MKFRIESGRSFAALMASAAVFLSSFCQGQRCTMSVRSRNTDVTCYGAANGTATVTIAGGTPPYTFSGSFSLRTSNDASVFRNLSPGAYSFTVTDSAGCRINAAQTISEPPTLQVSGILANAGKIPTNSSISITTSGGRPPYTFLWNTGVQTQNLAGLGAGTYALTVTDGNGCSVMFMDIVPSLSTVASSSVPSGTELVQDAAFHPYLYPNPSSGLVYLQINSAAVDNAGIELMDMSGRILKTMTIGLEKGKNTTALQLPVHSGLYMLRIRTGRESRTLSVRVN